MSAQEVVLKNESLPADLSAGDIMMNIPMLAQIDLMASRMAHAKATIPKHLQGNEGDCWAVAMQAVQWGMNPYAVAQKTHVTQGGVLGYEAQLINAVITSRAPIVNRPDYEFIGDWSKILGKITEKQGNSGGKYYVSAWDKADEEGLGVIVSCTLRGETEPRKLEVLLKQCWPRFSTQWATDPQQQITYAGVRKWARRYTPDVILGVYTPDEMDESAAPRSEREVGPGPAVSDLNDALKKRAEVKAVDAVVVQDDPKPPKKAKPAPAPEPEPEADPLPLAADATYADVMAAINAADSPETMQAAKELMMDFCGIEANEQFQTELGAHYRWKLSQLKNPQA